MTTQRTYTTYTRRQWLLMQAMRYGSGPLLAVEAVATTALEHPEWDMDEAHTWVEWEASERDRTTT